MTETTTEQLPAGTVLQVDPASLVLDENIRTDPRMTDEFVESIRTNGVLVPLQVRQDPLGQLLIVDGQRRFVAAGLAERDQVPVVVVAGIGDDEARITDQWILNEHRAGLTHAERAAAVQQMSLFGRSPSAIARKLGTTRDDVDAALTVASAPKVVEALAAEPTLDLVTAAKLVEFADDEDRLEELTQAAADSPENLDHTLELARREREVEQAKADKAAELQAQGRRIATDEETEKAVPLRDLSVSPYVDAYPPALTEEEHVSCPHRAFVVEAWWWHGQGVRVDSTEVCLDLEAAGHYRRFDKPGGASDEEAAAAKAAERKHTITQNAAADAAQEVRRRFITDQLLWERDPKGRMTKVPDGAVQHVAVVISTQGGALGLEYESRTLLTEWEKGKSLPAPGSSRTAAERALLRRVLAVGETGLPRTFWRSHHYAGNYSVSAGQAPIGVLHLRRLEAWGYGLAPIEREYLEAWDKAVVEHREREARWAAERAARDAEAQE